jgi:hypothetical protein
MIASAGAGSCGRVASASVTTTLIKRSSLCRSASLGGRAFPGTHAPNGSGWINDDDQIAEQALRALGRLALPQRRAAIQEGVTALLL